MSVKQKRERLLRVLGSAYGHHQRWQEVQEKAASHLRSMSNLAEQLAALRRCRKGGRLGCLAWYPQLADQLEAKVLVSFERALGFVYKHCEELAELNRNLKCNWKESERLLTDIIGLQGDERALSRTAQTFSERDITEWLKLLNAAHVYDLTEKKTALDCVACTQGSMELVCSVWSRDPTQEVTEVLECVRYTVEQFNRTGNG